MSLTRDSKTSSDSVTAKITPTVRVWGRVYMRRLFMARKGRLYSTFFGHGLSLLSLSHEFGLGSTSRISKGHNPLPRSGCYFPFGDSDIFPKLAQPCLTRIHHLDIVCVVMEGDLMVKFGWLAREFGRSCLSLLFLGARVAPSMGQTWPQRPVKLIVTLGPGSGVDFGSRLLADRLSKKWGQPVVIENWPGADAIVAVNAVIGGNDDHVLLASPTSSLTAHPYVRTDALQGIATWSRLPEAGTQSSSSRCLPRWTSNRCRIWLR